MLIDIYLRKQAYMKNSCENNNYFEMVYIENTWLEGAILVYFAVTFVTKIGTLSGARVWNYGTFERCMYQYTLLDCVKCSQVCVLLWWMRFKSTQLLAEKKTEFRVEIIELGGETSRWIHRTWSWNLLKYQNLEVKLPVKITELGAETSRWNIITWSYVSVRSLHQKFVRVD